MLLSGLVIAENVNNSDYQNYIFYTFLSVKCALNEVLKDTCYIAPFCIVLCSVTIILSLLQMCFSVCMFFISFDP